MFYPDKKPHISPSALQAWHNQRSFFIRSYFQGEKSPETGAMKAGRRFHSLIEGGFLPVTYVFGEREKGIHVVLDITPTPAGDLKMIEHLEAYGVPDSHTQKAQVLPHFVDYKTGRKNLWTAEKLVNDLKMKFTAWLVWEINKKPGSGVKGIIEWIATEWDGQELVPKDEPHEFVEHLYSADDLRAFKDVITKTVADVNAAYPRWLESTDNFVSDEDCKSFAELETQKKEIEKKQSVIKERVKEQLQFGGARSYESEFGSFFIMERKTYAYPKDLRARLEDGKEYTFEQTEEIGIAMSVAKKNWETANEPKSVGRTIGFRLKK